VNLPQTNEKPAAHGAAGYFSQIVWQTVFREIRPWEEALRQDGFRFLQYLIEIISQTRNDRLNL